MFDIDRMKAIFTETLEAKKENEAFVEYRHIGEEIIFTAFFELKYKYTESALDPKKSVNRARLEIVKRISESQEIRCRLFIVFEDNGKPPFDFYEIFFDGSSAHTGILEYDENNKREKINAFWDEIGLLNI